MPNLSQLISLADSPDGGADVAIGQHRLWLSDEDAAQLLLLLAQHRDRRYRRLLRQQQRAASAGEESTDAPA